MLEQRRAQEKGYITLKEAAELSNYTPDYVGQLLRSGKIKGEQVYANVAWVTTPEAVRAYLNKKNSHRQAKGADEFIKSNEKYFRYSLYFVVFTLGLFIMFLQYILYVSLDKHLSHLNLNQAEPAYPKAEANIFVYD